MGRRAAAARRRNRGIDRGEERSRDASERGTEEDGDVKRVTEGRRDDLGECRTQRAGRIGEARIDTGRGGAEFGEMADFVNDGALLRNQEQQQKAERFEHLSHSNVSAEFRKSARDATRTRGLFQENAPARCRDR